MSSELQVGGQEPVSIAAQLSSLGVSDIAVISPVPVIESPLIGHETQAVQPETSHAEHAVNVLLSWQIEQDKLLLVLNSGSEKESSELHELGAYTITLPSTDICKPVKKTALFTVWTRVCEKYGEHKIKQCFLPLFGFNFEDKKNPKLLLTRRSYPTDPQQKQQSAKLKADEIHKNLLVLVEYLPEFKKLHVVSVKHRQVFLEIAEMDTNKLLEAFKKFAIVAVQPLVKAALRPPHADGVGKQLKPLDCLLLLCNPSRVFFPSAAAATFKNLVRLLQWCKSKKVPVYVYNPPRELEYCITPVEAMLARTSGEPPTQDVQCGWDPKLSKMILELKAAGVPVYTIENVTFLQQKLCQETRCTVLLAGGYALSSLWVRAAHLLQLGKYCVAVTDAMSEMSLISEKEDLQSVIQQVYIHSVRAVASVSEFA